MQRRDFLILAGVAMTMPFAARSEPATPVIGFLHSGTSGQNANRLEGFRKGLAESGFVEGNNLMIEYRWANGQADRLPELASDLIQRQVSVIVTLSSQPATLAAKAATSAIPIVFTWPGDPIAAGLVSSLSRPGGNATGIGTLNDELAAKRLGLLREIVPQAKPISVLLNPADASAEATSKELRAHAQKLGVELQLLHAGNDSEIDAAFAAAASEPGGAVLVNADPFFFIRRAQITGLAKHYAMPAVYYDREFAISGGLMTYGTNLPTMWGQAGNYVARILKGERAGDLPVAQPTRFELVVNLKTAKMLGLAIPDRVLALADEVIE